MTSFREPLFQEPAPAKINLTLDVLGRRRDGFHELQSLVTFADVGDVLTLDTEGAPSVAVSGPFASALMGPDILERTLSLLSERAPQLRLGAVHLEKKLPVGAGIGGGSADAGALLRAVRRANGEAGCAVDWLALAAALGADVPVCFQARGCWMSGIGHALSDVEGGLPQLDAVLVNPMAPVPPDKTAQVFRAFGAGPLADNETAAPLPAFADREALVEFVRARGNQLAEAAEAVVPELRTVLDALSAVWNVEHVAVSGAGPTAFGVFPDAAAAEAARRELSATYPGWWIVATKLGETVAASDPIRLKREP